jgi:hypothetical protein
MSEGEGDSQAMSWVREYNAQNMSFNELADRIANHPFKQPKKGDAEAPSMARAADYKDAYYEVGTFDDVYRAQAFGLLTKGEMQRILDRVEEAAANRAKPDFEIRSADSAEGAEVLELKPADDPYLVKVNDGYIKVKVPVPPPAKKSNFG